MWKSALTAALVMSVVASCAEQFTGGDEEAGGIRLISGLCMAVSLLSLCRSFL